MPLPAVLRALPLPIIGAPLFIISNPKLVDRAVHRPASSARCRRSTPGRPSQLDEWLAEITETLAA